MKYPIKNFLLIFTAILLIGGSFFFAEYRNNQTKSIYTANAVSSNVDVSAGGSENPQDVDNDGDGSKDWEEILVGTDPNNPKSKPSASKSSTEKDLTKTATVQAKLDPIDLVSREFFARYMELRQLGTSADKASQAELAQKVVGNIVLSQPAEYKMTEILVKADSSKEATALYGQEIANIFKKYSIKSRNEAIIARDSLEKEDTEILKEIDPIVASYKNIINSLIKVKVPESVSILHLDLINSMNSVLFVAQSFRNSGVDPIKGVQGTEYYLVASKNFYDSINAIRSYFKYSGLYENIF